MSSATDVTFKRLAEEGRHPGPITFEEIAKTRPGMLNEYGRRAGYAKAEAMRNPKPPWWDMEYDDFVDYLGTIYDDHDAFMEERGQWVAHKHYYDMIENGGHA